MPTEFMVIGRLDYIMIEEKEYYIRGLHPGGGNRAMPMRPQLLIGYVEKSNVGFLLVITISFQVLPPMYPNQPQSQPDVNCVGNPEQAQTTLKIRSF